jgi:GntR family transcriptional regulator, transcriptional repressor for pyruvate dehydrogenase complex
MDRPFNAMSGGAFAMTQTVFTQARRVRSFEDVVTQIRDAITTGAVQPGDRLPSERELCQIFNVSRSTLREGIRALEATGMVEIRLGTAGGIFAAPLDGAHIGSALDAVLRFRGATADDLAEFRTTFEGENASFAARRADAADRKQLASVCDAFDRCVALADVPWPELVDLDIAFHEAVARASKNQIRIAIMLGINHALSQASASLSSLATESVRITIAKELRSIKDAIDAQDADLARLRMKRHVKKFSELERGILAGAFQPTG